MFAYKRHGVSYVARPPASIRPRKGLFKKASNLNYGLNVAIRVEEIMAESGGQVTDPVEVRLIMLVLLLLQDSSPYVLRVVIVAYNSPNESHTTKTHACACVRLNAPQGFFCCRFGGSAVGNTTHRRSSW